MNSSYSFPVRRGDRCPIRFPYTYSTHRRLLQMADLQAHDPHLASLARAPGSTGMNSSYSFPVRRGDRCPIRFPYTYSTHRRLLQMADLQAHDPHLASLARAPGSTGMNSSYSFPVRRGDRCPIRFPYTYSTHRRLLQMADLQAHDPHLASLARAPGSTGMNSS